MRKRSAAPMFVSCNTADHSRWCAQLAHSQCHHDIEEWISPLQVTFCITRVGSFTSPGIDTSGEGAEKTRAISGKVFCPGTRAHVTDRPRFERTTLGSSVRLANHSATALSYQR